MHLPFISVVMSVRNGEEKVIPSIQSILENSNINFEFIIVNDGSTDMTGSILNKIAEKDKRIILLPRKARGLTSSLIEACDKARGEFIARQDAYDYSMPNRLEVQANLLSKNSRASMCSSYVRFITEERSEIFIQKSSEIETFNGLTGIIHGSVMFRRLDYIKVGGYRKEFYFAQDVDLWSRLVEVGQHIVAQEILYENCLYPGSISGSRRKEQVKLHSYIVEATKARRAGGNESMWLTKASKYSDRYRVKIRQTKRLSDGAYFIGSCLINKNPSLAKHYLKLSIQSNPFNIRARLKILRLK